MTAQVINRKLDRAMTVRELIADLRSCSDLDAKVVFACDYGDRSHTLQALPVQCCDEIDDAERIVESAYSTSGIALEGCKNDEGIDDCPVVVLR